MMADHGRDDPDDDDLDVTNNGSTPENQTLKSGGNENPEIPFCGCLSVRFYQPYFDVDTVDIIARISQAMFYCKRGENFLAYIQEKPDAYGPFWIATTLIFSIAVTSHINSWLLSWMSGKDWAYDFQSIVTASSLIYGFASGAPVGIWFVLRQLGATTKIVTVISLYGYSLFVFIPATLVCLYPSDILSWIMLLSAAVASSIFLLRNLAPIIIAQARQQSALLLSAAACIQIIFCITLKFCFFYNK